MFFNFPRSYQSSVEWSSMKFIGINRPIKYPSIDVARINYQLVELKHGSN